jgi:hypothetical protein
MRKVMPVANAGMIGMRVRNDRAPDWFPRVDIEIACGAVQAFGSGDDKVQISPLPMQSVRDECEWVTSTEERAERIELNE